jgi:hypothetical protein
LIGCPAGKSLLKFNCSYPIFAFSVRRVTAISFKVMLPKIVGGND